MDLIKNMQGLWKDLTYTAPPPPQPPAILGTTGEAKWKSARLTEETPHQQVKDSLEFDWQRQQPCPQPVGCYGIEPGENGHYKIVGGGEPYVKPRLHPPGKFLGGR